MKEVYPVIALLEQEGVEVRSACAVLHVSRSGYYRFQQECVSVRQQEDQRLQPLVQATFTAHRRRYGARRIAKELEAQGEVCGRGRTRKIMDQMSLVAIQPKSFQPRTTASRHTLGYNENLVQQQPTRVDQVWVGDITYIRLPRSFVYLAMLMDLYSRKILGWTLCDHLRETLVLDTLRQAIRARQPAPHLIHHTDRGSQYASHAYRAVLARANMRQSMSRPNNPYDNAFMESCFGTLKTELEMNFYENIQVAEKEIRQYIHYYNQLRRHSAINYLSPYQFEQMLESS